MGGGGQPPTSPGRAIELGAMSARLFWLSLSGEPHVALRQFRPLRPQHRALFPGSAAARNNGPQGHGIGRRGSSVDLALLTEFMSFYT